MVVETALKYGQRRFNINKIIGFFSLAISNEVSDLLQVRRKRENFK